MMSDRWFRLPSRGDGTTDDPHRPDLYGYDVDGWSGNKAHPDGAPFWVVRVYGDKQTLDSLANEPKVKSLDSIPTQALNNMFGQNRDASGWENGFSVGGGQ